MIPKTIERKNCIVNPEKNQGDPGSGIGNSFVVITKEENKEDENDIDFIDFEDYTDKEYEIDLDYINNKISNPDY